MRFPWQRPPRILRPLVLIAVASLVLGLMNYARWQGSQYVGRVERLTGSGFILSDKRVGQQAVVLDAETVLKQGQRTVSSVEIRVGDWVMVVGEWQDETLRARVIRFIRDPERP